MTRKTMTAVHIALLQLVQRQPRITAAVATRTMNQAMGAVLAAMCAQGLVIAERSQQINGQTQRGYVITALGRRTLNGPRQASTAARIVADIRTAYTCPELGRTCQRPGAYDFLQHPSLIGGHRVKHRSAT